MTDDTKREVGAIATVTIAPTEAQLIQVWDSGSYRVGVTQTFQDYCERTFGRRSGEMRRVVVRELLAQGRTIEDISKEIGAKPGTISKDVRMITGTKRTYRRKGDLEQPTEAQDQRRERRKRNKTTEDRNAELLYAAMRNAPRGAQSNPMMNRASAAVQALTELSVLDPEVAASQVAGVRVCEYSGSADLAAWWSKFAQACEKRRQEEFPKLEPLRYSPKWTPEGQLLAEHGPVARAVLDLLAVHGRATKAELGVGIATANIGKVLRDLLNGEHITVDDSGRYTLAT